MRNAKSILVLLGLVLGAAVWNFFLYFGDNVTPSVRHRGLVDPPDGIRRIRLARADGTEVELTGQSGEWRLVSPFSGSADEQSVMRLLDAVSQLPVIDVLSDSDLLELGRTRADFALENPILTLELTDERGAPTVCRFGAPTAAADGIYASVDGVSAVYVVNSSILTAVDVPADGFRRRSLFPPSVGPVSSLSIRQEGGAPIEFVRTESGWSVGGKAAARAVSDYVVRLSDATAVSFVWPVGASNETDRASASLLAGYGLDSESAVSVTLTSADGANSRVLFGKSVGDGLAYALVQNGGAIVTLPVALRDFLLQDPVMFADSRIFPEDERQVIRYSLSADGGLYSLSRGADSVWRLDSPVTAVADQEMAATVLSRILALSPSDVVEKDGVSVSIGTNSTKVMVAKVSVLGQQTFESFRSREMLKIDPTLVRRIVGTPRDGTSASVVYDRDLRQWSVENGVANATVSPIGVEKILSVLNPLKASRIEKLNVTAADLDDYGLDVPTLTVAIDQSADESVRRNILVGKKTKDGWFATIGSSDAVFVIPDGVFRNLSASLVKP